MVTHTGKKRGSSTNNNNTINQVQINIYLSICILYIIK